MKLNNLKDLLEHELNELYDAENQILEALPMMKDAANSPELKRGFDEHLQQTQRQIRRLEQAFDHLNMQRNGIECIGMRGLIQEGQRFMREKANADVMDAALIAAAQKVEHYEIAAYGTARAYARLLNDDELDTMLLKTLDEEGSTDEKLSQLAMTSINIEAM